MKTSTQKNLLRTALLAVLACALPSLAGPDNVGVGTGRTGAFTTTAPTTVVNRYAQVTAPLAPGDTAIQVLDATGFAAGDLVMVLQMTGIVPEPPSGGPSPVDLTNDPVGRWEFARLASVAGTTVNLTEPLIYSYAGNVTQIIRVPEYTTVSNTGRQIVAQEWNGTTGGVVAFLVQGAFTNFGQVVATGRGFREGKPVDDPDGTTGCSGLDEPAPLGAQKGEGIAVTRYGSEHTGRGRVANGGGGGVCYGAGGGGGGNGGTGGQGGNTDLATDGNRAVGGEGGAALTFSSLNHLLMGGGGGAGHAFGVAPPFPTAGAGGGIIFVRAGSLVGAGSMIANGGPGRAATGLEAGGGGGAGGTIYLRVNGAASCGVNQALGGVGGNTNIEVGPGGGGGGGRILFQKGSGTCNPGPANVIGVNPGQQPNPGAPGGAPYGATAGGNGSVTTLPQGPFLLSAPVVLAPGNGASINDNTPTYSGTLPAPFPAGTEVVIYVDGTEVGRTLVLPAGTWEFTPVAALADGAHSVNAIAINTAQGVQSTVSNTNTFTLDSVPPPPPVVVMPANGSTITNNQPAYTGSAEPNAIVTVIVDGSSIGTTTANAGGGWTFTQPVALPDGPHTVRATATDAAGNTSGSSNTNTFTVDTTPPAAPVVLTPANGSSTTNNTPTYTGTAEPGSTVTVIVDGTSIGTTTANAGGTWSLAQPAALAEGPHTVNATAADAVGNTSPVSNTHTFTVDTVAPAAPVVVTPANGSVTRDNTPTFSGTAEASSTEVTLTLTGPSGVFVITGIPVVGGSWSYTPAAGSELTDGQYTVSATARDAAGNLSPVSNTHTFTVDTVAPAAPVVVTPPNGSTTNNTTVVLSGTAEPGSTVLVVLDNAPAVSVMADAAGNWSLTVAALTDGVHTVNATATDAAGNESPVSNTNTFTVDTVAPVAPVVTRPPDGSTLNTNTPTYQGTAEANSVVTVTVSGPTIGTRTFTVTADAAGAWSVTPAAALPDGQYTVSATSVDAAGNLSPVSNTNTFTVDTAAPAAPVVVTPANGSTTNDTTPDYSGTAEPGSTVTVTVMGPTIGTRTFTVTADAAGAWSVTPAAALPDGQYTVSATSVDVAGNPSPVSNTNTFTVDTLAPAAPVVSTPADGSTTSNNTPLYSGTAEAGSTVTVIVDGTTVGTTTANAAGAWEFTPVVPLADGPHTVRATARDAAGNTSLPSNTHAFVVDTLAPAAPVVVAPANGSTTNDNTPDYSGTAEPGSTVTVIVDGTTVGTTTATAGGTWTFTPATALADGPHTVRATATDAGGNTSPSSDTNAFVVDTATPAAPVVVTPADGSFTNDTTPDYSGTAEAGSTVTVIVDGAPVGTTTANAAGSWTLTQPTALAAGPHTVRATATDAGGNTSVSSNTNAFTVDVTAPAAPVVLTPLNGSTTSDNTPTYTGTAEAGSTVTVIVDGSPVGTTVATVAGTWSFTPTGGLSSGSHTVMATATDAAGNTSPNSNTNTFIVDATPPAAPVVLTPANNSTTNDNTPAYSGTAEANTIVTVIVDGSPVGTTTADAAGNWSFTPTTALADGPHTVRATAADAGGNTSPDSNTHTFTVDTAAPAAPVVVTPANNSTTNDNTPDYSGTAEPGSTVTVIVDGSPVGTATADAAGSWSFTPTTALADGPHTVSATATDAAGNTGPSSATHTFTVDTAAPAAPVVQTPANGSTTSDSTPAYSGTADPGTTVTVIVDGTPVGTATADAAGNWSFTPVVALAEGPHTVNATATDAAGNTSPVSNTHSFTVDTLAPAAPVVVTPANGSTTNDSTPSYSGTAEPGSTVTVFVDSVAVGTATVDAAGNWTFTPTAALADGSHTVSVTAEDAAGNTSPSSATHTFTVDTTAPAAPVVVTPADGSTGTDTTPAYTGTAEAGSTVTVIVDGTSVGTTTADASGAWSLTPTTALAAGQHTVKATATDAAGNVSPESNTHTFTLTAVAPAAPVVTGPANNSTTNDSTPTFTGTAPAGSTVTIFLNGQQVGTTTADANGNWSFTPTTPLEDGQYVLTVTATDSAGNVSVPSGPVNFTVETAGQPGPGDKDFLGDGVGCASTAGDPSSALAMMGLALLAVLGARRRQR